MESAATENEDVSDKFFKLCEGLEVGEMVTTMKFSLGEVMSAIELMEPKMDVGVGSSHLKSLDDAITEGLYADDIPLQIAVMDATLAMVVAWLEGASLSTTVWTNVMLARSDYITQPLYHAFCSGINLLVRNIYSLVNNVGNTEELPEDFNPQVRFNETRWRHRHEVVNELRLLVRDLEAQGASWYRETGSIRATEVCSACCARLDVLANLLDIMACLVPPEIDDPLYEHRIHLGGKATVTEKEYERLAKEKEKPSLEKESKKTEEPQKQGKKHKGKKNKKKGGVLAARKNVLESVPEEKTPKTSPEKDSPKDTPKSTPPKAESSPKDSKEEKNSPKDSSKKEEEPKKEDPPKAKECCSDHDQDHDHSSDCTDEDYEDDEDYPNYNDLIRFQPNFAVACPFSEKLAAAAIMLKDTVRFGRRGPDDQDGDYKWLMPFDQKACIRMVPACFPRNVKYPTREEMADWFLLLAQRIHDLCRFPPKSTRDINMFLFYAQQFNAKSCVLTRSLLQVIMFPFDSHMLGGILTCEEPVEASLRNNFMPQVLDKDSPVHDDPKARELYTHWLAQMSKCMITLYTSFGCNLTRQRDRLEQGLEELSHLQFYAGRVEERTDEVMIGSKTIDCKEQNPSYHSIATFVFHNVISTVHYYFELGFRMDLYVPYEFTYMYWFLGNIDALWMLSTMERSNDIQTAYWKGSSLFTTVNQRRQKEKQARLEEMERRSHAYKYNMTNQRALQHICDGILILTVVLFRKEVIKMPEGGDDAERLRFERRFECLQSLGPPLNVSYDMFKQHSKVDLLHKRDVNELIDEAAALFNEARIKLEHMSSILAQNPTYLFVDAVWSLKRLLTSTDLLKVAKNNIVACNLLKLMDLTGRKVEWAFLPELPMFPYLSIK